MSERGEADRNNFNSFETVDEEAFSRWASSWKPGDPLPLVPPGKRLRLSGGPMRPPKHVPPVEITTPPPPVGTPSTLEEAIRERDEARLEVARLKKVVHEQVEIIKDLYQGPVKRRLWWQRRK